VVRLRKEKLTKKNEMKNSLILSILLVVLIGCGTGDESGNAFIDEVRVTPDVTTVGELVSVIIDFSAALSDSDFVDPDSEQLEDTEVLVILPKGVDFVPDSSDLDGSDIAGFRKRPPNTVEICQDGSRALYYDFGSGELTDGRNRLRLQARPFEPVGEVRVGARAERVLGIPCSEAPEETDFLLVN
jgi:hypothetical protein